MVASCICVARHGETDWNAEGKLQGWLDVPINGKGRQQARALAGLLAHEGFSAIYASTLARSVETAEIMARELGLPPPLCHPGLRERNFGVIQGIPKVELSDLNPILFQQIVTRNPACEFEEGESMDEFADRVEDALVEIGLRTAGGRALIITHGWVLDVVSRLAAGLPRQAILHVKPRNGQVLWVEVRGQSVTPSPHHATPLYHAHAPVHV